MPRGAAKRGKAPKIEHHLSSALFIWGNSTRNIYPHFDGAFCLVATVVSTRSTFARGRMENPELRRKEKVSPQLQECALPGRAPLFFFTVCLKRGLVNVR